MNLEELKQAADWERYGRPMLPKSQAYVTALESRVSELLAQIHASIEDGENDLHRIAALEEQCTCYGYACQHLRLSIGLDNTREDLSECLEKFRALETTITDWQKLIESIIDNCSVTEAHVNRYRELLKP